MTPWSASIFLFIIVTFDLEKVNVGSREIEKVNSLKSSDWHIGRKRWQTRDRLLRSFGRVRSQQSLQISLGTASTRCTESLLGFMLQFISYNSHSGSDKEYTLRCLLVAVDSTKPSCRTPTFPFAEIGIGYAFIVLKLCYLTYGDSPINGNGTRQPT